MIAQKNTELNYNSEQDFVDCRRGYVDIMYPETILKGENAIWDFAPYRFIPDEYTPDSTPGSVHKSLWRQAHLNKIHGWFRVCEGVYQFRGYDMANLTLVETDKGIVVIDCTTAKETAEKALELYRNNVAKNRPTQVRAVILTHTHTDHYGGIEGVTGKDSSIPVYAPENFVTEAALENVIVGDAMSRRTTYQYGTYLKPGIESHVDSGLGKALEKGGTVGFAVPDYTVIPNTGNAVKQPSPPDGYLYEAVPVPIDNMEFEFLLCPHTEAPAEMTIYIRGSKVLIGAEILNHTLHNLLTPRGAEVRDARLWWKAIDRLLTRYPETEIICATHHWPIWNKDENGELYPGKKRCSVFLEQQRDSYKFLHDQTVRLINQGFTMLELAAWFDDENNLPDFMKNQWHNRGYYGTISHDVRAIYQKYLGWYDMNPSNLNPLPQEAAAKRYIAAIGEDRAYEAVIDILKKDIRENQEDYRWAAELGKQLVFASQRQRNREVLAKVYQALGFISEAGTWRDMYLVGAAELLKGGPMNPSGSSTANPAILNTIDDDMLFDYMASRLNPKKITDETHINISQDCGKTYYHFTCGPQNCVLNFHREYKPDYPTLMTDRQQLVKLITGSKKSTDPAVCAFFSLLESVPVNFNIVLPKNVHQEEAVIPAGIRRSILACAMMFEKYEPAMAQLLGDYCTKLTSLLPDDMAAWKDDYYQHLTVDKNLRMPDGTMRPYLEDNLFYKIGERMDYDNYGIGSDGIFYKHEYCHFLYECYKVLSYDAPCVPGIVRDCINMLEEYIKYFRGGGTAPTGMSTLNKADMVQWEEIYHPALVKTNIIVDDKFFDPTGNSPHWGIGTDGKFNLAELCNVLARCYKLLLINEIPKLQ